MNSVVVTGIGMLTALGQSRQETFDALLLGQSGVAAAPEGVRRWLPAALAASVGSSFESRLTRHEMALDRATKFALLAAREAISDSELLSTDIDRSGVGVFSGIGMAGAHTLNAFYASFYERLAACQSEGRDPTVVHPLAVPRIMANSAAALLSIEHRLTGPTQTYSVACSSSAMAIGEAFRAVQSGRLKAAVALGSEAMLVGGPYMAWNALRVMAVPQADDVGASCRPFDRRRSGFVLGEGASALILETEQAAVERGARIYGRVCGYGCTSDAWHVTLPSSEGQSAAMKAAIRESGLPADAIGYVNAHGTATEAGDVTETESLKKAFGTSAAHLAVSSTKSMHGHLIGGAGALEFGISLLALQSGSIPPTTNLTEPDPRCDLDYVPNVARHGQRLHAVMSNSFAFGGCNVSLIASALNV